VVFRRKKKRKALDNNPKRHRKKKINSKRQVGVANPLDPVRKLWEGLIKKELSRKNREEIDDCSKWEIPGENEGRKIKTSHRDVEPLKKKQRADHKSKPTNE